MRITWLLEAADQLWGGVKVALEDANALHRRGHQVTVLSRSEPPAWMQLECAFRRVQDFHPEHLPDGDVVIGTFWTTVPWAASAGPGKGVPVHYCQGYEGDNPENAALRDRIEAVYRLPGVRHVTISSNLTQVLRQRFGIDSVQIPYAIDHGVHFPGPERAPGRPLRVGLVGPFQIAWKDLATGYAACRLAHAAGQPLVLVRATNTAPDPAEADVGFPVEWHQQLPPARMGDFYRSLDVFLGTSRGAEEGFFLPAVEAMACGVPTVLTDVPCFRSHARGPDDEPYALFAPPQDPAAMAEALVVAGGVTNVRSALRAAGLRVAARYTGERHAAALEAALRGFVPAASAGEAVQLVGPESAAGSPGLAALQQQLCREAEALLAQEQPELASRCLEAATLLAPEHAETRLRLAEARLRCGDAAGALAACAAADARGADGATAHTVRGAALHALGRVAEAAGAFQAALAAGPRTADACNRLGVVLYQAGDLRGARTSFEQALQLEPGHGDARCNLAALPAA